MKARRRAQFRTTTGETALATAGVHVALSGSGREGTALDDDVLCGGDALADIAARVKLARSPDGFLLELLGIQSALLRSSNEQRWGGSAVANDNALENKFATGGADVILGRPERWTNSKRL